ncbi:hypothetical protein [Hafnia alvei]|uniref:Uncharacterized protein n=1 Tax=Hafnia alvei TaxID=569 RepID=A0A1C6YZX1_HAFAL|nr:hypothetical protein [Hafnia alvei]SCM52426.1 hypothetical protein BN1044_01910 [Hafnia alvei]
MDLKTTQRILQAAIDQYPRLIALSFELYGDSNDPQMFLSRFQAAFEPLFDGLIDDRIYEGKLAPPTQLRYLWFPTPTALHALVLLNQNSIWQPRDGELCDAIAAVIHCLNRAGQQVSGRPCIKWQEPPYLPLDRTQAGSFQKNYTVLLQHISNLIPSTPSRGDCHVAQRIDAAV